MTLFSAAIAGMVPGAAVADPPLNPKELRPIIISNRMIVRIVVLLYRDSCTALTHGHLEGDRGTHQTGEQAWSYGWAFAIRFCP